MSKNNSENEFSLLSEYKEPDLKSFTNTDLLAYLKDRMMTQEKQTQFLNYFYPGGYNEKKILKPEEFYAVGIIEHISYFPLANGDKYSSTAQSLQEQEFTYWRRIKGDGNCYYRSVLINYLEILILYSYTLNDPAIFFSLIKDLFFTEFEEQHKKLKDNTICSLLFMYNSLIEERNVNKCFDMLYRCYNRSDVIEKTLIKWLRTKLGVFLKANLDLEVNGIKLVQLIPGFELEDDLSYDKAKVHKYIDKDLNKMDEFVEGYPLYITPLILDLDINIYMIDESGSYKVIAIDTKYSEQARLQMKQVECFLYRFNGCKYSINTLFRIPHYDTIYHGEFIEILTANYKNEEAYLELGAINENQYDLYLENVRRSHNQVRKNRNPLSGVLGNNTVGNNTVGNSHGSNERHIVIDINKINQEQEPVNINEVFKKKEEKEHIFYICIGCLKEFKSNNLIVRICDDKICKSCFENYIQNLFIQFGLKSKIYISNAPSHKIIDTLKQFKIFRLKCYNQECTIDVELLELKNILDTYFNNKIENKISNLKISSSKDNTKYCNSCCKNTNSVILIHGCIVCKECQRRSIKIENNNQVIAISYTGQTKSNKCINCRYTQINIDDYSSLFEKFEIERNKINTY